MRILVNTSKHPTRRLSVKLSDHIVKQIKHARKHPVGLDGKEKQSSSNCTWLTISNTDLFIWFEDNHTAVIDCIVQ